MPHWNFEYTKVVVVEVEGGMGQGPATEATHLRLNQSPVFLQFTVTEHPTNSSMQAFQRVLSAK